MKTSDAARKKSCSARITVLGGTLVPERRIRQLHLHVAGSELAITGDTSDRWTLVVTHRPRRFEVEFMETEGGGLLRGEGATLSEAVEAAHCMDEK